MTISGFTLLYPWMLLTIALCYTAIFFHRKKILPHPIILYSTTYHGRYIPTGRQRIRTVGAHLLFFLMLLCTAMGAARPVQLTLDDSDRGRNIMLVVDVSPSMEEQDFVENFTSSSRMEGVKKVVSEFIRSRTTDRMGLVVFGGRAFLQSPLTKDHGFLLDSVAALKPSIAGDGTALGDAIGVGLKRLQELPSKTRAMIVVTDGASNAGRIDPLTAAEVAKNVGITVHTIGIGDTSQNAPYDGQTLESIAKLTNGMYRNAGDIFALRTVTEEIEKLLESQNKEQKYKSIKDYSKYFSLAALIFLLSYLYLTQSYVPIVRERAH